MPLSHARSLYGNHDDLSALQRSLAAVGNRDVPLVDLSPFFSIGTPARQEQFLEQVQERRCVFVVPDRLATASSILLLLSRVPTVVVDSDGIVQARSKVLETAKGPLRTVAGRLGKGASFFAYRTELVAATIEAILKTAIRRPPAGRRYIRLSDDTSANVWLDVKSVLRDPNAAFMLAYHAGYELTSGYSKPLPEDGFLVGNNTSFVLACLLQEICCDKEVIVLDRLGPFPHLTPLRLIGYERQLKGKTFCIIEDVISTCREIDLITMTAFFLGGSVTRALALFDFEIGSSLLLGAPNVRSIVRPRELLRYVRVPKFQGETQKGPSA